MHELAVCQAIVAQVEAIAQERDAQVCSITLQIGPLSGVEPSLLKQAYPLASAGSRSEHARLVVESPPVRVSCKECKTESDAMPNRLLCAQCGRWQVDVISGDELLLGSVELEIPESAFEGGRGAAGVHRLH